MALGRLLNLSASSSSSIHRVINTHRSSPGIDWNARKALGLESVAGKSSNDGWLH